MKKDIIVTVTDKDGLVLDSFSAQDLADEAEMTLDQITPKDFAMEAQDVILRAAKQQDQ